MFTQADLLAIAGLAVLVLAGIIWFRRATRVAIPDDRRIFLASWALAAVLGLSSFFGPGAGWLSGICGSLAVLGGSALLALHVLRKQGVGEPIAVGDRVPEFTAMDESGVLFESAGSVGSPLLLKFFRGHW